MGLSLIAMECMQRQWSHLLQVTPDGGCKSGALPVIHGNRIKQGKMKKEKRHGAMINMCWSHTVW
jgi:hypothetical protein